MSRYAATIDVATEYAYHLYKDDGVPKEKAIAAGVAAVIRAVQAHPSLPARSRKAGADGFDFNSSLGWSGPALAAVGSTLSAIGWIKTFMTGAGG